jgi:sigma-B regulation protein RsbU (phosphoserine phosphatase)
MAAVIQSHLHPEQFPDLEGFRLAVRSSSSRQVAGDTYDVLIRDNALIATVTDVSGKGVGAGMIAAGVHAGVRLMARGSRDLSEVAGRINSYLAGATADNRFATFAMVSVDPDGEVRAVNAGHIPVLIRRTDGTIEEITSSGLPLGILEMANYEETVSRLEPGDLVVLFTDGITEAEDHEEEEFGVERVADVTAKLSEPSADKLCDAILEALEAHTGGGALHDDATLLVVERLPKNV